MIIYQMKLLFHTDETLIDAEELGFVSVEGENSYFLPLMNVALIHYTQITICLLKNAPFLINAPLIC